MRPIWSTSWNYPHPASHTSLNIKFIDFWRSFWDKSTLPQGSLRRLIAVTSGVERQKSQLWKKNKLHNMQIQNLQINHACLYVFLKPEKTLMFFGFFLHLPQWIKLIPNLSEQFLTAGVYCASFTRHGQEDSCCCCGQPVLVSENTVCWLIWCLLSSRWDHPLHPPHPLLPFTPTDWDWDWEGGWCRSFCFLTPTPWPRPPLPSPQAFILLSLQGL